MSVSTRTRFEVFKRDRFTCQYCGRKPPEALLHLDHIVATANGGSDDPTNLVTSCSECNLGKSDVPLDATQRPGVSADAIAELEERVAQAKAYAEFTQEKRQVELNVVAIINDAWAKAFGAGRIDTDDFHGWEFTDGGSFPRDASIKTILRRLPLEFVLEAVDVTEGRWHEASDRACRYFYGVCWRMIRERGDASEATPPDEAAPVEDHDDLAPSGHDYDAWGKVFRLQAQLDDREAQAREQAIIIRRLREELGRDV
jgi:hypothetical protein